MTRDIIGELACGHFNNRQQVFDLLGLLPPAKVATHSEVLYMIDQLKLMGHGIGYIDACFGIRAFDCLRRN